jgi:hypothetical protein
MLTGSHETQRTASVFTFLERYHKAGDEFLSRIVRVTGDEIWVSFVNVETKTVKTVVAHTFTKQAEKVQTNVCQKGD